MQTYRLDFMDGAGSLIGALDFLSADDRQALEEAANARCRYAMVLRQGERQVAFFLSASDLYVLTPPGAEAEALEAC